MYWYISGFPLQNSSDTEAFCWGQNEINRLQDKLVEAKPPQTLIFKQTHKSMLEMLLFSLIKLKKSNGLREKKKKIYAQISKDIC